MHVALLLLAGIYGLPDPGAIPAPTPAQQARIERAFATLRTGDGVAVAAAMRDLALVGEPALPAIAKRLNDAPAGERLGLLGAVRSLERAKPLLDQATRDPHAAVRAWAQGPPPRAPVDLRLLARRYLKILAIAERKLRAEADEDYRILVRAITKRLIKEDAAKLGVGVNHTDDEFYAFYRARMRDQRLADEVRAKRQTIASRFAIEGGRALVDGRLSPDLTDPVFIAYVGLLREDGGYAFYNAVTALCRAGAKVAPALEALLRRPNHDARKVVRVLCAVREDRGAGLCDRIDEFGEEAQRALVVVAPRVLPADAVEAFLDRATMSDFGSVRIAALDGLLALPAPAGREAAGRMLDPVAYGVGEFSRAARLLSRCGDLERLRQFATVAVPDDGTDRATLLRRARQDARYALGAHREGDAHEALGRELMEAEDPAVKALGLGLVEDRARLLEAVRAWDDELASVAAARAVRVHGAGAAREVVAILRGRGLELRSGVLREIVRAGAIDLLVELAGDAATREDALHALADLDRIDQEHEEALLAVQDGGRDTLEALVPLGTPKARARLDAAEELRLDVLVARAEAGLKIGFAFPLKRFVADADAERLEMLGKIADALPEVEPGLFAALVARWDELQPGEKMGGDLEGAVQNKVRLLDALARSKDAASARLLFDSLVTGEQKENALVLGTLKAAARLVPPDELKRLVPVLREQVTGEYALADRAPPPVSLRRWELLRGGMNALALARVPDGLAFLCEVLLDPDLYLPAFDWRHESFAPWWALDALRLYPSADVATALDAAIARAEEDGRLARLHPRRLFVLVEQCRRARDRGRWLGEVAVALCDVLDRVGWQGEVDYHRMLSLGALRRWTDAAEAGRRGAARKRAAGFTASDGFRTPEYLEARALLYDAVAAGSVDAFRAALDGLGPDPLVWNTAAWYLAFYVPDRDLAARAGETAVRGTAGLYYPYRDTLAAVRLQQGRPADAVALLDPARRLPVKREPSSGWNEIFLARAHLMLGNTLAARHTLENALAHDRRLIRTVRSYPEFQPFADVFKTADTDFFDELFSAQ